nr:sensor histidine kinase [Bacteriovorax sp. HI3]
MKKSSHFMRPSGRHILTIGKDLIQDPQAAIIELVKNAYDADSSEVHISLKQKRGGVEIIIADTGHGMSGDILVNKWLVPSTDDKASRKKSPAGRIMQGRKGIGRYSASILGDILELETIDLEKNKSHFILNWSDFQSAKFLDEVPVEISTEKVKTGTGTKITIFGGPDYLKSWTPKEYDKLITQLKKLKSPNEGDGFKIFLHSDNYFSPKEEHRSIEITPFKILEYFDYKVNGSVDSTGIMNLEFHNQRGKNIKKESIKIKLDFEVICGNVIFDIRVFDREPAAIEQLIKRGLQGERGEPLQKIEARRLLDTFNGVAVYRNGFRVRPLGEPGFDWLKLDARRVQMPSLRISSNQVIGSIFIESEEESNLDEKSARDGLKDNIYYSNLINVVIRAIKELEPRRFKYRQATGQGRDLGKIENRIESLFHFDDFKAKTKKELENAGVKKESVNAIMNMIENEEREKSKIAEEIRRAIALYQGQATLGKIMNVVLHEGRRPLAFFRNQVKNIKFWGEELLVEYNQESHNYLLERMGSIEENSQMLVKLFDKIDPLASGRRGNKKSFKLNKAISKSFDIFEDEIIAERVGIAVDCPDSVEVFGWEEDFIVIFTNLIDNSLYWLKKGQIENKGISISVEEDEGILISFVDNGPGIPVEYIENKLIFEPEFSLKDEGGGSGLGLAIAGEASERNGFTIGAIEFEEGAYFQISSVLKEKEDE